MTPKIALNPKLQYSIEQNQMNDCYEARRMLAVLDDWMSAVISDNGIGCGVDSDEKLNILSHINIIRDDYKAYLYDEKTK